MVRGSQLACISVILLSLGAGCRLCERDRCDSRPGWFSSRLRSPQAGQLMSQGRLSEGCYDAVTGQPVPCPPMPSTPALPTGSTPPPPTAPPPSGEELPWPGSGEHIRPPGVPSAPAGQNATPPKP
ncbi:hypothetical protein [Thermogemmata fonticola]|uniref:Uncharacterized protein n=1 Tax=Thermogemmata fonticola TaxID=2755323 RepID=A0A7V9ABR1_9BACT|nr:hypothetical protein [Thermogemmata fonticola]MBA2226224.1 hypothetical protein [Thermogemmata fonticola]